MASQLGANKHLVNTEGVIFTPRMTVSKRRPSVSSSTHSIGHLVCCLHGRLVINHCAVTSSYTPSPPTLSRLLLGPRSPDKSMQKLILLMNDLEAAHTLPLVLLFCLYIFLNMRLDYKHVKIEPEICISWNLMPLSGGWFS